MTAMADKVDVAITGIGLVAPLGSSPGDVLDRILGGETAFLPAPFSPPLACRYYAPLAAFDAAAHFPENKNLRLMNRDAQLAVVAAHLALRDAAVVPGAFYPAEEIALYGATGMTGLPPTEIAGLVQNAAADDGSLDLARFGQVALRRIRPVLSFKILANMPLCFVSIFENLRGPNAVYTPWEGHGAVAIAAGIRAVADGEVPCAVVGGCDVRTHAMALAALQQLGAFDSWTQHGTGSVPGEGAAFLVLEDRLRAIRRGARVYAVIRGHAAGCITADCPPAEVFADVLRRLGVPRNARIVAAGDGEPTYAAAERAAIGSAGLAERDVLRPKSHIGNLYAAAAAVQVALAAALAARERGVPVLANCFGYSSQQAAFLLEAV